METGEARKQASSVASSRFFLLFSERRNRFMRDSRKIQRKAVPRIARLCRGWEGDMERMSFLYLIFLLACLSLPASAQGSASASEQQLTAYEVLESYGFPAGLLPSFVNDYTLGADGRFVVELDNTCSVDIPDAYPVKYASKISGQISYGSLRDLNGITVKAFFFWWNIDAISLQGTDLVFKIGIFSQSYSVSNFSQHPDCESRVEEAPFAVQ